MKDILILMFVVGAGVLFESRIQQNTSEQNKRYEELLEKYNNLEKQQKKQEEKIAFHATISEHHANIEIGKILVFDQTTTNIGEGYNNEDGVFTAPVDGVYQFNWTYLTKRGGTAYLPLMINGQLSQWSCINTSGSEWDGGNGYLLTRLKKGDRVWIQHHHLKTTFLHLLYTTFSGFKV